MANYKDFEMLNSALSDLAHQGIQKKTLDQNQQQFDVTQGRYADQLMEEASHHRNLEANQKAHYGAEQQHWANTEAGLKAKAILDAQKGSNDQLFKTMSWIRDGVTKGAIPATQANQQLKGIAAKVPPEQMSFLQSHPLGQILLSGQDIFADPVAKGANGQLPAEVKLEDAVKEAGADADEANFYNADDLMASDPNGRYNRLKQASEHAGTGHVPSDSITTRTAPDPNKPWNTVTELKHVQPGQPPPVTGQGIQPPAAATVRVRHPNGQTGTIPASQIPEALKAGYKQVQ